MEPIPQSPDPADRPSSVSRRAAPEAGKSESEIARALPAPDPADEAPTIISLNRPRPAESVDSLKGKKLGHFELIEPIGVGGMGAVIRAQDLQLGRVVALKILPPEMAVDPENISRFKQEARAAAKLDHENVARVYYCGEDQGLHFIAFEYVDGTDLRTMMANGGPLRPEQAVKYMLQVAAGLAHAASRGVIHRDIKPSNIIITPEGRAKIVDMGLARHVDAHGGVTQSGVTLGTFDYISPEQAIEPRAADIRSDIYSLGCTFYHLLTGQPPVPEGTAAKKLHHHQHVAPVDPREFNPAIPDALAAVLGKMMAKEPRDRYQRAEQLIQHLLAVAQKLNLGGEGSAAETVLFVDAPLPQPSRFSPVLVAVAAIAAVAILAVILGTGDGSDDARPLPAHRGEVPPAGHGGTTDVAANPGRETASPPVERERTAANIDELARLLAQNIESIVLTGDDYNLDDLPRPTDSRDGARLGLGTTRSLKLVGKDGKRPVIRWKVEGGGRDGDDTVALLNVAAAASAVRVELRHLRFEVDGAKSDAQVYAVAVQGAGRVTVDDCEFIHDGKADLPYGGSIQFEGAGPAPSVLELRHCLFGHGSCAVDISNRGLVRAEDCAFGQHAVVFLFHEKAVPAANMRLLADLTHCTVRLREGTIFNAEANVNGVIRAADCVFGRDGMTGEVVLLRQQTGGQSGGQKVLITGSSDHRTGNVYHGLVYWADPDRRTSSLADCKRLGRPFAAADLADEAVEWPPGQSPWKIPQPADDSLDAFALRTDRPELRTPANPQQMVGVNGKLYPQPLAALVEPPAAAGNVRLVDPDADENRAKRVYKSLETAIADAPEGELTILIKHNGPLPIAPQTLSRPNLRLTIRPEGKSRPILTLGDTDVSDPALFTVRNGSVTLKDLQFHLRPGKEDDNNWLSVAAITGGGQCTIEDCTATLETKDDATRHPMPVLVSVVSNQEAVNGAGDKRPTSPPKIHLKDCIVRGTGHVVAVRGSRPFDLEADNVLAVLHGSLAFITGQVREQPLQAPTLITCRRVTTYLTEPVLDLRVAEGDKKAAGLARTEVKCEDCLLVAASAEKPLVFASGVDRDTLTKSQVGLLGWTGERNLYGNFVKYLDVKTPGAMMMPTEWGSRDWGQFTNEGSDCFPRVQFKRTPDDAAFARAEPAGFQAKVTDMQRKDVNAASYGVDVGQLPKLDELKWDED